MKNGCSHKLSAKLFPYLFAKMQFDVEIGTLCVLFYSKVPLLRPLYI